MREVPGILGYSGSKGSKLEVSWELPEALGRSQGLEMLRTQGKQAGSKGSKLEVRHLSWGFRKAPGKFQRPRDAQGARGVSWEFPEASGRSQGPRDAQRVRGTSWE